MKSWRAVGGQERALVDVEVEVEAHLEQQAPLDQPGRHVGRADRAQQQGVEAPPLLDGLVGEHHAVAEVAGAAEVVVDGVELDAGRGDDLERLGDDLGADAVAADDTDAVGPAGPGGDLAAGLVAHGDLLPRTRKPPTGVDGQERTPRAWCALVDDDDGGGCVAEHSDQCGVGRRPFVNLRRR